MIEMEEKVAKKRLGEEKKARSEEHFEVFCYGTGTQSKGEVLKSILLRLYREESECNDS